MIFHIDMLFQMSCKGFAPMLCTEAWKSNPLSKIAEHLSVWIWHLRGLVVAGFPPGHKHQEAKVSRRVWLRFLVPRYYVWFVFETLSRFTDTWVSEVKSVTECRFELDKLIRQPVFFFNSTLKSLWKCSLHPVKVDLRTQGQAGDQGWRWGGWEQASEGSREWSRVLWIKY